MLCHQLDPQQAYLDVSYSWSPSSHSYGLPSNPIFFPTIVIVYFTHGLATIGNNLSFFSYMGVVPALYVTLFKKEKNIYDTSLDDLPCLVCLIIHVLTIYLFTVQYPNTIEWHRSNSRVFYMCQISASSSMVHQSLQLIE